MKSLGRLLTGLLLLGNLAMLAALSFHVVVTQGKFAIVAKEHLTLMETYTDVRHWTPADLQAHPMLLTRLTDAGRLDLVSHIGPVPQPPRTQTSSVPGYQSANPAIVPALNVPASLVTEVQTPAAKPAAPKNPLVKPAVASDKPTTRPAASTDAGSKSIFDFGR